MTTRHRTVTRLLAVLAALAVLGAACGGDDDEPSSAPGTDGETAGEADGGARYGGTITVGLEAESNTWEPGRAQLTFAGHVIANTIYDPLVAYDEDGVLRPFLAESLEPDDELTQWTLTLRPGITFHDGTPLDAETLKWNFDELHFHDTSLSLGVLRNSGLVGMEIVDELTVRYELSAPNAAFPDVLTSTAGWPISRQAYEADPEGFGDAPVGTGPFVLEEWSRDDRLVVTRNPDYWRDDADGNQLPYLDQIVFRPIPDEQARLQSLYAGDVDVIQARRGTTIKQLVDRAGQGEVEAEVLVGDFSDTIMLNTLEPPLDDARIRQALAHATDAEAAQVVLDVDGLADPSTGFYSPTSPWYSETVAAANRSFDLAAAQELVEAYRADPDRSDGLAPGSDISVRYSCMPEPSAIELAQLVQSLWQDAGVEVELQQLDQPTNISAVVGSPDQDPGFRGTFSTACWQTGGGTDPLLTLQTFYGPVAITPTNFANLVDPAIDELVGILQSSADPDVRFDAVEQIGLFTADQVPVIWLSSQPSAVGHRTGVEGLTDWRLPSGEVGTGYALAIPRFYEVRLTD